MSERLYSGVAIPLVILRFVSFRFVSNKHVYVSPMGAVSAIVSSMIPVN